MPVFSHARGDIVNMVFERVAMKIGDAKQSNKTFFRKVKQAGLLMKLGLPKTCEKFLIRAKYIRKQYEFGRKLPLDNTAICIECGKKGKVLYCICESA